MSAGARNERFGSMGMQSYSLDAFRQLVQGLSCYLASSPSSAFKDINHRLIIKAMENYTSQSSEWDKYAHKNEKQCFTRNLVDPGNGRHNLLILVWSPGKESPIHDHAGSHCIMKMLQGSLRETRYDWPDSNLVNGGHRSPLQPKKETVLSRDDVTYITDSHGLHKISNPDPTEYAVSLHLYAPPNAAREGCQVFDEYTGEATHIVRYDLFSEMGRINEPKKTSR
ncbi:hypothetical protein ABVK25_005822 [Lepraria finkii]|uniref:Cysteine dioxygenase n=1 Tax=Lepraria finkii TaxID=1340010 RepID=A0ABR4B7Q7_9LECA